MLSTCSLACQHWKPSKGCCALQAAEDLPAAHAVMSRYMDEALQACLLLDSPVTQLGTQLLSPVLQSIAACVSALAAALCVPCMPRCLQPVYRKFPNLTSRTTKPWSEPFCLNAGG